MPDEQEPADGTRIEFQEHGAIGGDLIAIYRHDESSAEAGWPTGDGGEVWCEYGRSVPITWAKVLADPRLAAAVGGTWLVPLARLRQQVASLCDHIESPLADPPWLEEAIEAAWDASRSLFRDDIADSVRAALPLITRGVLEEAAVAWYGDSDDPDVGDWLRERAARQVTG